MKHVIYLNGKPIVLVYGSDEQEIDVDEITKIDYSNIYGEAVTISTLLNRIGQLRAEAERLYEEKKLERNIMESELEKLFRKQANKNEGKFLIKEKNGDTVSIKLTEKSITSAIISDKGYQVVKSNEIKAKRDLGYLDSLYWAIQDKSKKLNNILPQVTPQEFEKELIEGTVNGILIRKNFNNNK